MNPAGPTYAALGHLFRATSNDPRVRQYLTEVLAPLQLARSGPAGARHYRVEVTPAGQASLHSDHDILHDGLEVAAAVEELLWRLNAEAALSWPHLVLHAAGVVDSHGGAVLLVGESGAGKSTLAAAAVMSGWDYLSDELVPLSVDGRQAWAFPKSLSLKQGSWDLLSGLPPPSPAAAALGLRNRFVPASDLRAGSVAASPVQVRTVVLLHRDGRDGPRRLGQVRKAEAVSQLARQSFNLRQVRARGLHALAALASHATVVTLRGGTVAERVRALAS